MLLLCRRIMPRTQQLALATGVLWAAIANAAGIRAHEDVPVTTPAARRLQTTVRGQQVCMTVDCCLALGGAAAVVGFR